MSVVGQEFEVDLSDVRMRKGNDRIEDDIEALMRTLVVVRQQDGSTRRVALLGGNDLFDPGVRQSGKFRYTFDPRLVPILRDSKIFGILEMRVMAAFSTKYALTLYELLSKRWRLDYVHNEVFQIDELKDLLGVPEGKLPDPSNVVKFVLRPAIAEINALAPFNCDFEPIKTGRKFTAFQISWWQKSPDEYRAAAAELERPKSGRKARIKGTVDSPMLDGD